MLYRTIIFTSLKCAIPATSGRAICRRLQTKVRVDYPPDEWTNITPSILKRVGTNLHNKQHHPLGLIKQRIVDFFYTNFTTRGMSPLFSVYDNLSPIVTLEQNFDTLLIPKDHPSRAISESYYFNSNYMLRAHTTAHQKDLIRSGLNNFLIVGDVYRRDSIDASHFPVFHQFDGVRLFSSFELFEKVQNNKGLEIFEVGQQTGEKQCSHTLDAAKLVEYDLKSTLENLAVSLFGKETEMQWVDAYFPFTHPSWELEIKYQDQWLEVLGCGIMEQEIINTAGAEQKVGWAFGMGLERLAMKLYNIPDIRLFWSEDSGFLSQFRVDDPHTPITFKPVSQSPQCINDMSFWVQDTFTENDFYDLVRSVGGDIVEQVELFDSFFHPKKQRHSHAFRLVYRHMERALTKEEVNVVHENIASEAVKQLGVEIR